MLFNSYSFIFLFLPFTLLGFGLIGRFAAGRSAALAWLIACSVVFYALWNPINLLIIAPSIALNYLLALRIRNCLQAATPDERGASRWLWAGLVFNLSFLGYFKYRNFFLDSVNQLAGTQWPLAELVLPLGISFVTFQKIAFLVDVRARTVREFTPLDFLTFVFFFPQLIAGPIVHYRELMPQFVGVSGKLNPRDLCVGLCLFAFGLFKKTVLADNIAPYATGIFEAAERGEAIGLFNAWLGAMAFLLQVYFDFSGYSDMAIGLARLFGIRLPLNFFSPLKAVNIIDFWTGWHVTLTRFLTAYAYSPLLLWLTRRRMAAGQPIATNRNSKPGAFALLIAMPTVFTMFLSGLWHGAGVNFILWGLLHGVFLTINHAWRQWRPQWDKKRYDKLMRPWGRLMTLAAVVFAIVLFRARSYEGAKHMMQAMLGQDGAPLPAALLLRLGPAAPWLQSLGITEQSSSGTDFVSLVLWVAVLLATALFLPNSQQVLVRYEPVLESKLKYAGRWQLRWNRRWALWVSALLLAGVFSLNRVGEFLYWQF
jgi:alginate O-acetyltransferase complex protein AlgI